MLLDTSGLLSFLDRADKRHADAIAFFEAAPQRVTHGYVLAELVALCNVRGINRASALDFVAELQDNPLVVVEWVGERQHRAAVEFLQVRMDKRYSLCDAVSFLLMQEYHFSEALTTDHHFTQAGFICLLKA